MGGGVGFFGEFGGLWVCGGFNCVGVFGDVGMWGFYEGGDGF